jgi:hypothetical protein
VSVPSSFCNPESFDDFYALPPTLPERPAIPGLPPAPKLSPLADPDAPGNLDSLGLPTRRGGIGSTAPTVAAEAAAQLALEVRAATSVAKARKALDESENFLERLEGRVTAFQNLVNDLSQVTNLFEDTASLRNVIRDIRQLLTRTLFHDQTALDDFDEWTRNNLDPMLNWADSVNQFMTNTNDVNQLLANIAGIAAPWDRDGNVKVWCKALNDSFNNVLQTLNEVDQVLAAAEGFVNAAATLLLAICHMLPALDAMLRDALEKLQGLDLMGMLGNFFKLPVFNFKFKFPQVPLFDRLARWAGMANNLDDLFDFLKNCIGPWTASIGGEVIKPNMNAFKDGVTALRGMQASQDSFGRGLGKLNDPLRPNPFDPVNQLMRDKDSNVDIAPNPSHITPDEASTLGASCGLTQAATADPKDFPIGASRISYQDLVSEGIDPETGDPSTTPAVPGPEQYLHNHMTVTQELCGTLKTGQVLGEIMNDAGEALKGLGPLATEADAKLIIAKLLKASRGAFMLGNLTVNEFLSSESLAQVAKDFYACYYQQKALGDIVPESDATVLYDKMDKLLDAPAGLPNSMMAIAALNNPLLQEHPYDVVVPFDFVPAGFYSNPQVGLIAGYLDPETTDPGPWEDLPFALISEDPVQWQQYLDLKNLMLILRQIQADPVRVKAHQTLKQLAVAQGRYASSPYCWLGDVLESTLSMDPYDLVIEFLRHGAVDIRPFATQLERLTSVDEEVPIPADLAGLLEEAAQESYAYTQQNTENYATFLRSWRLRADTAGGPLGFEYFLGLSALTLMERAQLALEADMEDAAEVPMAYAQRFTSHMSHAGAVEALLTSILEGAA